MKKIIIGACIVFLIMYGYFRMSQPKIQPEPEENIVQIPSVPVERDVTKDDVYTNKKYNYSIHVPPELEVVENSPFSIQLLTKEKVVGPGPANFIYVSVVEEDNKQSEGDIYKYNPHEYTKLSVINVGETISLADTDQHELDEWFTYKRLDDTTINGKSARVFENSKPWEFPPGTIETRYLVEADDSIYIFGYYTGGDIGINQVIDPKTAFAVVQSFQFN